GTDARTDHAHSEWRPDCHSQMPTLEGRADDRYSRLRECWRMSLERGGAMPLRRRSAGRLPRPDALRARRPRALRLRVTWTTDCPHGPHAFGGRPRPKTRCEG